MIIADGTLPPCKNPIVLLRSGIYDIEQDVCIDDLHAAHLPTESFRKISSSSNWAAKADAFVRSIRGGPIKYVCCLKAFRRLIAGPSKPRRSVEFTTCASEEFSRR